jgi:hypothetical protein
MAAVEDSMGAVVADSTVVVEGTVAVDIDSSQVI